MWVLCCYLPLMIGEMVYENDSYWCNFISLLEISRYLFGPKLDEDDLAVLNVLITEHHRRFRVLYPSVSVISKMHYTYQG